MPLPAGYEFGAFRVDCAERALLRDGKPLYLRPKDFDTLLVLVERAGHIVGKEELLDKVWPDTFVEEGNLAQHISNLRRVLGDHVEGKQFIETIPKRGYRFVAAVREIEDVAASGTALESAGDLERAMLVVLPVENLSGNPDLEYVTDGFTEAIISELGCLNPQQLGVIARTSAMAYKGTRKTIREIAGELDIHYALECSLRHSGGRMLLTVQLIEAGDQTHLWAKNFDHETRDVVRVQCQVAQAIADEISIRLSPQQQERLGAAGPVHPEAYEQYLKARHYWNQRTDPNLARAIACLEQAITLDPTHAPAQSTLAACWTFRALYGPHQPSDTFPRGKAAARRALELDKTLADAHACLGLISAWYDFDWDTAEREFRRAVELGPNNATVHNWYALYLAPIRRFDEALRQVSVALRLDPLSAAIQTNVAWIHVCAKRYHSALEQIRKILASAPNFLFAQTMLGNLLSYVGSFEEAIPALEKACELSGWQPDILGSLGHTYAIAGRRDEALGVLQRLAQSPQHVSPYYAARIYAGLGETQRALEHLELSLEERSVGLLALDVDFCFRNFHGDPRFEAILRRVGFPRMPGGSTPKSNAISAN